MNYLRWLLLFVVLTVTLVPAQAQDCPNAPALVAALVAACPDLTRGQACFADGARVITRSGGAVSGVLDANDLTAFTLDGGAALVYTQANYLEVTDSQVALLFVGDVQVTHAAASVPADLPPRAPLVVSTDGRRANVRVAPRLSAGVVTSLDDDTALVATGQTADGWLRIVTPDLQNGWISASLVSSDYDLSALETVAASDPLPSYPAFTPMQAFILAGSDPCGGVLALADEGAAVLNVNGASVELNGTAAFIRASTDALTVFALNGPAIVYADEGAQRAMPGSSIDVPLLNGSAGSPPLPPVAYDAAVVATLSGDYAGRTLTVAAPASDEDIRLLLTTPLEGNWYVPAYSGRSTQPGCVSSMYSQAHVIYLEVADDGSSFSLMDPIAGRQTWTRTAPGIYESWMTFQVLSPTQITATYDADATPGCDMFVTMNMMWIGNAKSAFKS